MSDIEKRISDLKKLGAGDGQCIECLNMKIEPISVCKKCIKDTPAFTDAMNNLCKQARREG